MDDVLDQEAAQDDAAWRQRMDAACALDGELDAEEALMDCIVEVFAAVCAVPAVPAVEPEPPARCVACESPDPARAPKPGCVQCVVCLTRKGERAEALHEAGRCVHCRGPKEAHLHGERCRKCLDVLRDRNRRRQGFKGRVYRCSLCWTAGHNRVTCALRGTP